MSGAKTQDGERRRKEFFARRKLSVVMRRLAQRGNNQIKKMTPEGVIFAD